MKFRQVIPSEAVRSPAQSRDLLFATITDTKRSLHSASLRWAPVGMTTGWIEAS
jgi:hypothetical protein